MPSGPDPRINGSGSLVVDLRAVARLSSPAPGSRKTRSSPGPLYRMPHLTDTFSYRRQGQLAGRNVSLIGGKSWSLPGLTVG
jgi:copper oxidase (laccase) domain-containing protein